MIYDASTFGQVVTIEADLCIVGSGAGGAAAAAVAAEAGLNVLVLEAGPFVPPRMMNQREEDMMPPLLLANGSQRTADRSCGIIQGRALGGSTVHNTNLCKRIPGPILDEWIRTRGLQHLPPDVWQRLYEEVERDLAIAPIAEESINAHNRLFRRGCRTLGWANSTLSHNRTGCVESGYCSVGCTYDAKNNAAKIYIPRAIAAGAQVIVHAQAVRVRHTGGAVTGVEAVALDPITRNPMQRLEIVAPRVCLSGSATGSPAILRRSEVPDPSDQTGTSLTIHPALVAAGEFDEPVEAWKGIPQSVDCTEFLDFDAAHPGPGEDPATDPGHRTWLVPVFAHPMSTATMLPTFGAEHRDLMSGYKNLAVFTAMIHDLGRGEVAPRGDHYHDIHWQAAPDDARELLFGLQRTAELLFAAGARRVVIPARPIIELTPSDSLAPIADLDIHAGDIDMTAVHPMSTVPMGDDPTTAPVDSRGKHHHLDGLWVADGSLFPTSIGGPPQVSIYALGLHVGRAIAAT